MTMTLDDRDQTIVASRVELLDADTDPRCGDYVEFSDGVTRRISHVFPREWGPEWSAVQTSDGGSFYLGDGYVSYSGGLYPAVPMDSLTLTPDHRDGSAWVFHHNHRMAHNGVDFVVPFRVYTCDRPAPR